MAKRLKIKTLEDHFVHFDAEHNEYTLCGLDILGDDNLKIEMGIKTHQKVNCPMCISIVAFCKAIKNNEMQS